MKVAFYLIIIISFLSPVKAQLVNQPDKIEKVSDGQNSNSDQTKELSPGAFYKSNIKIGFGSGNAWGKNNILDFSDHNSKFYQDVNFMGHNDKNFKTNIKNVFVEFDLDGKNSFSTGINLLSKGMANVFFNGNIFQHEIKTTELPLQYSRFYYFQDGFFFRFSPGIHFDFIKEKYLNRNIGNLEDSTANAIVTGNAAKKVNFTLGIAISFGYKFEKLGSLEMLFRNNFAFFPFYNYEIDVNGLAPINARMNVNGTYQCFQIAYSYPILKFKKKKSL